MITIKDKDGKLHVTSPYNATFVTSVKGIGGKWNAPCWVVGKDKEDDLHAILKSVYGWTPNSNTTIKVEYNPIDFVEGNNIKIGAFIAARRKYRDGRVELNETIVIDGELPSSCGSQKRPEVLSSSHCKFRSTIPLYVYESLSSEDKDKLTVVGNSKASKEDLLARKAELLKQLKEVEKQLETL